MDTNYVNELLAKRANINEVQKGYLESIHREGRMPSAEENVVIARQDAEYDELSNTIERWMATAQREQEHDIARAAVEGLVRPAVGDGSTSPDSGESLARWFRGDAGPKFFNMDLRAARDTFLAIRAGADAQELRALYTDGGASGGSLVVPVNFQNSVYTYLEEVSGVRQLAQIFSSAGGGAWTFPKTTTIGLGTQVSGQGTALAGTDPVLGTIRLDSYRYGELVKVSTQMLRDTGFDILGYIAQQIGYAVGRVAGSAYVNGSGSGAPNGIITAASVGATTGGTAIALGGGAAAAYTQGIEPLIDLQHSVAAGYADRGAFLMNRTTAGTLRKLRDQGAGTIGSYVWTPTTTFEGLRSLGEPGMLLGSPVVTDWNMGTNGSAVKPVAFGDWSSYYIRDVGSFRFERSDDYAFNTDEVTFRGVLETDADLIDTNAIKVVQQKV